MSAKRRNTLADVLLTPTGIALFLLSGSVWSVPITNELEAVTIPAVGAGWQTVTLDNTFGSPVVVCTYNLPSSLDNEAVVRVRNAAASSFDVRIQRPLNSAVVTPSVVHCLIAEEGQHSLPDGRVFEAHTRVSNTTSGNNAGGWNNGTNVSAQVTGTYTNPAVLGQVMTYNDADFSAFWSYNCSNRGQPAFTGGRICVGKHIGQTSGTRANETLGYIVVEGAGGGGTGSFNGISYSVARGGDSIAGVGNTPPYSYNLPQTYSFGVATKEAEDGGQGGWAVLYGADPLAANQIDLAIDEETVAGDTSRRHTNEQVAFWVFNFTDYGDAPASYNAPTAPSHTLSTTPALYLGTVAPDSEADAQPGPNADLDDTTDTDDEDGVTFSSTAGGGDNIIAAVTVTNTTGSTVTLCGWLDVNRSGAFGGLEIQCNTAVNPSTSFEWIVNDTTQQSYYARFRVCSVAAECTFPFGAASDGEVEDYVIAYNPTLATIGDISLEETAVADLLAELTGSGADLLALLAEWDPDQAASLDGDVDATAIEQALGAYLDPDGDGAVALLRWTTIAEQGTVGFFAERQAAEEKGWERLNNGLLPALIDAPLGGEYWLADPDALSGHDYDYRLIEQEAWGTQRHHGPWRLRL